MTLETGKDQYLTVAQAAERLRISERSTRRLIKSGKLVAYKPLERKTWIHEEEVMRFLETHKTTER